MPKHYRFDSFDVREGIYSLPPAMKCSSFLNLAQSNDFLSIFGVSIINITQYCNASGEEFEFTK